MELPERFKKDYEIKNGQVKFKKDYKFESDRKGDITIPKEHIIVTVSYKDNKISNLSNKVSHAYLLKLKEKHNIKFGKYDLIPNLSDGSWGYLRIGIEGTNIVGDGEVIREKLPEDFKQYAFTIMFKRAEDRAISKFFGIDSEGFLTESEILNDKVQYDDLEIGKVSYDESFEDKNINNNVNNDNVDIILLLVRILKVSNTEFNNDLLDIGHDNLYDCTEDQQRKLVTHYESKFGGEDHLREVLLDYVKEYKISNNWTQEQFKDELVDILKIAKNKIHFDSLIIDELYDIILDLGLHE